jgi:hypothetical protein
MIAVSWEVGRLVVVLEDLFLGRGLRIIWRFGGEWRAKKSPANSGREAYSHFVLQVFSHCTMIERYYGQKGYLSIQ